MVAPNKTLSLVEVACARLCHDLSGLVGTLTVALGMAADGPDGASEPVALAEEAAEALSLRLKLFRAAWGPDGAKLTVRELRDLAGGLTGATRLEFDFSGMASDKTLSAPVARLALNALILAGEALPAGGRIALSGGPKQISVAIAGPNAAWPARLASALADETAALASLSNVHTMQSSLIALLASAVGARLSLPKSAHGGGPGVLRLEMGG